MRSLLQHAIEPLERFLKAFEPFLPVLRSNADEYTRKIEGEDQPRDIDSIKDEIAAVERKKRELREKIPEVVHVSCFEVHCKEILAYLEEKQEELAKQLKQLIAKRAKEATTALFNDFTVIKSKINEEAKDIETLTELKEYMANMP
jgi:dynein heavy chain